jgi:hypothetical protein
VRHPVETMRQETFFKDDVMKIPEGYYAVITVELKLLDSNPSVLEHQMAYA